MNSDLYFCQLSDLVLSMTESTMILDDGTITNLMVEEALLDTQSLNTPLPWVKYTSIQSQSHIRQLQKNKFLSVLEYKNLLLVKINYPKRLQILSNFFNSEYHNWAVTSNKKDISWQLNKVKKINLNSFSSRESYLVIPNRLVSQTFEIPLPLHFSLIIDPHFENQYSNAIYQWVKILSEDTTRNSHQTQKSADVIDFLKSILVDIGGTVIIDNDVINLKSDNLSQSELRNFSFIIDQKTGLSIQIKANYKTQDHPSVNQIRNLDLGSGFCTRNLFQSTDPLKSLIEMHLRDIQMLNARS